MRIVSLSPSSTEILFAIGAGDDVVAVTQLCDHPADASRRERLGSWLHAQTAAIDALRPDLIVTTTYLPEELRTYSGRGEILHLEPTSIGSVFETALLLGHAVGRYHGAEILVQGMERAFEEIRACALPQKLRVYCEAWPDPPMQAGNWIPELVEIAGGLAVGDLHAQPSIPTAVDALHATDPDVLIFHWCDAGERPDPERIRLRQGWSELRAMQANSFAFLFGNLLNRPGPRLVDGARQLQAAFAVHQHAR